MREVLVFNLENEQFGLDISCVREVLNPQEIYPLPQAPDFIEGVVNLREHIIAVVSLRKRFNLPYKVDSPQARIIVCRIKKFVIGLMVDSVSEVSSLSDGQIQPEPGIVSLKMPDNYILGFSKIGEKVVIILDLEKILTEEETKKLSGAQP
jgi:purine-binding chemotaxis protein CheW